MKNCQVRVNDQMFRKVDEDQADMLKYLVWTDFASFFFVACGAGAAATLFLHLPFVTCWYDETLNVCKLFVKKLYTCSQNYK